MMYYTDKEGNRHAMSQGPGTRIIATHDKGTRTVYGIKVRIEESIWNEMEDSPLYDVYRVSDDGCLTADGSLDSFPGDDTIRYLILTSGHTGATYGDHVTSPVPGCASCEAIDTGTWRERYEGE